MTEHKANAMIISSEIITQTEREVFMYIFVSHSSKDALKANELCLAIESQGDRCFLAPRDIRSGYEYASEIINGIDESDAILLLLSADAVASPHVLREIERAVSKGIPVIVYKLEEVQLSKSFEYFLMSHQWLDGMNCTTKQLIEAIKNMATTKREVVQQPVMDKSSQDDFNKPSAGKNNKVFLYVTGIAIIALLGVLIGVVIIGSDNNINSNNTVYNSYEDSKQGADDNSSANNETNSVTNNVTNSTKEIQAGATVLFGKYNNAEIAWKVLSVSDDKTEAVLIARDILTFKGFDGADSGKYSFSASDVLSCGTNSWEKSSIRTWLNSDKDYVQYEGKAPTDMSMSDGCNGYDMEPGFLYGFSSEEISAIKETVVKTDNNSGSGSAVTTMDKVFLLSRLELDLLEKAGVSMWAVPTSEAVLNNESSYYKEYCQGVFHVNSCQWWLRDPVEGSNTECYQISHGAKENEKTVTSVVCADGYGIRPVLTVDLTSGIVKVQTK